MIQVSRLSPGQKVKFSEEGRPYVVQAANERFAICTKPFNPRRTVLYSIADFKKGIRGTENLVFCFGFETQDQCEEALARLAAGESEVSRRNQVSLHIDWVREPDKAWVQKQKDREILKALLAEGKDPEPDDLVTGVQDGKTFNRVLSEKEQALLTAYFTEKYSL